MQKFNFHTHTTFCDGRKKPERYILAAMEKGMSHLGFSGHAPVPFPNHFAIATEEVQKYCNEILRLKKEYADRIAISLGMEFDYIPVIMENLPRQARSYGLEYYIAAVHMVANPEEFDPRDENADLWFIDGSKTEAYDQGLQNVFHGDIRKGVRAFFEQSIAMLEKGKPDIIGHMDKIKMNNKGRYFQEDETWYQDLFMQLLQTIKQHNVICEINTRGIYRNRHHDFYPSFSAWKTMREMNIPVTFSADAHKPEEVDALFEDVIEGLKTSGYKEICYFENGWKTTEI